MLILDTDYVQVLWHDGVLKDRLIYQLENNGKGHLVGTTVISLQENLQGWLSKLDDGKMSPLDQVPFYMKLDEVLTFYRIWDYVLPFDDAAAIKFINLR